MAERVLNYRIMSLEKSMTMNPSQNNILGKQQKVRERERAFCIPLDPWNWVSNALTCIVICQMFHDTRKCPVTYLQGLKAYGPMAKSQFVVSSCKSIMVEDLVDMKYSNDMCSNLLTTCTSSSDDSPNSWNRSNMNIFPNVCSLQFNPNNLAFNILMTWFSYLFMSYTQALIRIRL